MPARLHHRPLLPMAGLTVLVLLAHAWLLAGLPLGLGGDGPGAAAPLTVRQIVVAPSGAPAPTAPAPRRIEPRVPAAAAASPVVDAPATAEAPAPEPPPIATTAASALPAADVASQPAAMLPESLPAAAAADGQAAAPTAPVATGERLPVYATRPPAAVQLRYELRRGLLTGEGELLWRPGPEGYELQIEGRAFGLPLLQQASTGRFDAAGLAPQRFVDRRRGRDRRAANFQHDKGLITYSGAAVEHPLLPGAQDRLSWMLQLAAIVEADPARFGAGERITMQVSGVRGDADAWVFTVLGHQAVELAGGRAEAALALRREPRKPFDTLVEVWLDPARQHLPVRLKLAVAGAAAGAGEALELLLAP